MRQVNNVWMPDGQDEICDFLRRNVVQGKGVYQYHKLEAALSYVKNFRTAIDVGAHVGLWSMNLTRFKNVIAFEPVERHRECFRLNAPSAQLYTCALGDKEGTVRLTPGIRSSGDTHIKEDGEYEAGLRTLDSYGFTDVDFMKLDCEGYELFALRGGEKTLLKWKPVIIVEQKPGKAKNYGLGDTDAVKWLEERGYTLRKVISGDYILD